MSVELDDFVEGFDSFTFDSKEDARRVFDALPTAELHEGPFPPTDLLRMRKQRRFRSSRALLALTAGEVALSAVVGDRAPTHLPHLRLLLDDALFF